MLLIEMLFRLCLSDRIPCIDPSDRHAKGHCLFVISVGSLFTDYLRLRGGMWHREGSRHRDGIRHRDSLPTSESLVISDTDMVGGGVPCIMCVHIRCDIGSAFCDGIMPQSRWLDCDLRLAGASGVRHISPHGCDSLHPMLEFLLLVKARNILAKVSREPSCAQG